MLERGNITYAEGVGTITLSANDPGEPMKTMAWRVEANTFVLVHGNHDVSDDDWVPYIDEMGKYLAQGKPIKTLVVTPGPGPSLRQRQKLNEVIQSHPVPTAVLSGSAVARTVVTILRLRNPEIRAFEPGKYDDAFKHLELPEAERVRLLDVVAELKKTVGEG